MYTFKKADVEKDFYMASHLICNLCEIDQHYEKNCVLLQGKLRYLFGEPTRSTKNVEEQYDYFIQGIDNHGKSLILNVYSGASGPAIGGLDGHDAEVASSELALYLRETKEVEDYDYEGYYLDGPSKVKQGIKNGEPYYVEEAISIEEAERYFDDI